MDTHLLLNDKLRELLYKRAEEITEEKARYEAELNKYAANYNDQRYLLMLKEYNS